MKTTLNIPNERMIALLEATQASTRTEAINLAIEAYIHRENVRKLMSLTGTGGFLPPEELFKMRESEQFEGYKESSDSV